MFCPFGNHKINIVSDHNQERGLNASCVIVGATRSLRVEIAFFEEQMISFSRVFLLDL